MKTSAKRTVVGLALTVVVVAWVVLVMGRWVVLGTELTTLVIMVLGCGVV